MILTTDLIYHDLFIRHEMTPGHPESPERLKVAMKYLEEAGLLTSTKINLIEPHEAHLEDLVLLHDRNYLEGLRNKSQSGGGYLTLDTAANEYTYNAAVMAAGGGVLAVDRILDNLSDNAYVMCRPPGHHAEFSRAFGFCFINNIAVAANHLVRKRGLERVLIVDYDAHHGNGTQNAFYSSSNVLYIGLHQDGRTLFPGSGFPDELGEGQGEGYNINLAMYPRAGDQSYYIAFQKAIKPIADSFRPQFILVSVGYDAHFGDPLTSLGLTHSGLAMMNRELVNLANTYCNGRLVFFLEGGYNLDVIGRGSQNLLEELSGVEVQIPEEFFAEDERVLEYTEKLVSFIVDKLGGVHF